MKIDLLDIVRLHPEQVSSKIIEAIERKPEEHLLEEENIVNNRNMNQIGG